MIFCLLLTLLRNRRLPTLAKIKPTMVTMVLTVAILGQFYVIMETVAEGMVEADIVGVHTAKYVAF